MRFASWAALAAVVVWSALPTVSAQALDPVLTVTASTDELLVAHNGTGLVSWTVQNGGQLAVTVSTTLDGAGGIWSTNFQPDSFTLASGAARTIYVRVATTASSTEAQPDGVLRLTATATDDGGRSATASDAMVLVYGPAPVPPVPPVDHTVRNALVGTGAALLVASVAYLALGRLYSVHAPKRAVVLRRGAGELVRLEVVNRAPWRQAVRVRLRPLAGLVATTDADLVEVKGRSQTGITLFLRTNEVLGPSRMILEGRTRGQPWHRLSAFDVESVRDVAAARPGEPAPQPTTTTNY